MVAASAEEALFKSRGIITRCLGFQIQFAIEIRSNAASIPNEYDMLPFPSRNFRAADHARPGFVAPRKDQASGDIALAAASENRGENGHIEGSIDSDCAPLRRFMVHAKARRPKKLIFLRENRGFA